MRIIMRRFALITLVFVLTGCQAGLFSKTYLPFDYSEADKNSREIWLKFEGAKKSINLFNDCSFLVSSSGREFFEEKYKILRNGRILYSVDVGRPESYEFRGLRVKPPSALITNSGINGLQFEGTLKFEFNQDVQSITIEYSGVSELKGCYIQLAWKELADQAIAVAKTVKSSREITSPALQESSSETGSTIFCRSDKILPVDCAEEDKNSREIWFNFNYIYGWSPDWECLLISSKMARVTVLRNGNALVSYTTDKWARNTYEFLGFEVEPKGSLVNFSGVNGSRFEQNLSFEFNQDIESIDLKYSNVNTTIRNCKIEYINPKDESRGLLNVIKERRDYEVLHADAIELNKNFGNIASPILQEKSHETVPPSISFSSIDPTKLLRTDAYQTFIRGKVIDNEGVLTLLVNGKKAAMKADGTFAAKLKLRIGINKIPVLAEDINGNIAEKTLTIIREDFIPEELADVDIPPKTKTKNPDGIAIVIGVENYQYVSDATYAYNDAEVFREYLADTMGYSKAKVKIVTNSKATKAEFEKLLSPNGWLARNVDPGKSEIIIYFSGHGIPNPKTKQTGLLPFDVDPNYSIGFHLSQLYESLGGINAKSVTVFLDACFTGENRERKMLLADVRGIVVVPRGKSIPNNLTVLSAASGGQFSGALKEKEHGLFTYYVLKGLGGDADSDKDNKLTMGELGKYVRIKVKERAAIEGREQTPELQGDPEKILVEW